MTRAHRLVITVISAVIVGALTSSAAFAAGFLGPGHFSTDFADATSMWFPDANSPYFAQVSVNRNTFVFRPTQNSGGTSIMQHSTVLQVQLKGPAAGGSDCFIIPDSDFVVGSDVQSASVNATVNAIDRCPGFAEPLAGLAAGKAGGGGPPPAGGIQFPLTVSANWSGNGATSISTSSDRSSCGGLSIENHTSTSSARATATGSLSMPGLAIAPSPSERATVDQGTVVSNVQGSPSPLCVGA
jgi:hypothetical protein